MHWITMNIISCRCHFYRLLLRVHLAQGEHRIQSLLWVLVHLPNLTLLPLPSGLLSGWLRLGWWTVSSCSDRPQTLAIIVHRRSIEGVQDTLMMVRMIKNLLLEVSSHYYQSSTRGFVLKVLIERASWRNIKALAISSPSPPVAAQWRRAKLMLKENPHLHSSSHSSPMLTLRYDVVRNQFLMKSRKL